MDKLKKTTDSINVDRVLSAEIFTIKDFDAAVTAPLSGFKSVEDYYTHMGLAYMGRLKAVRVPLLAVHACDDPLVDADTFLPVMKKTLHAEEGNPNCWYRFTRTGGHVGFCRGADPRLRRHEFMSASALDFAEAVLGAKKE